MKKSVKKILKTKNIFLANYYFFLNLLKSPKSTKTYTNLDGIKKNLIDNIIKNYYPKHSKLCLYLKYLLC